MESTGREDGGTCTVFRGMCVYTVYEWIHLPYILGCCLLKGHTLKHLNLSGEKSTWDMKGILFN